MIRSLKLILTSIYFKLNITMNQQNCIIRNLIYRRKSYEWITFFFCTMTKPILSFILIIRNYKIPS